MNPRELPDDLVEDIGRLKFQGTSPKVNFALDGIPVFPPLADRGGEPFRGFLNIGPSMDYLERAFDEAKYGWYSSTPYIDGAVQSTIDPDMAPPGKHVMSCFIQYTPYRLRESDWDAEREPLGDAVQATLERYFPGFGDLVLQREVVTPLDIERTIGSARGTSSPASCLRHRCSSFARRRAGRSTGPRSPATTSAGRGPIQAAA